MHKKLLALIIIVIISLLSIGGRHYSYVDHKVYIYKFLDNYRINFVDRYESHFIMSVDSEKYNKFVKPEYRKNYYKIRVYDNGKCYIISDNYGK